MLGLAELLFEELTSAAFRREVHALSKQIERARRNELRVVETQKAAVGGAAGGSAPADEKKVPEAKPMPIVSKSAPKSKKPSQAATLWKSGEVARR